MMIVCTLVIMGAVICITHSSLDVNLAQVTKSRPHERQSRLQKLYDDVPYNVDPVISTDSYIPNFQAPEARNPIYQGEESDLVLPSIYESGPHIDEITPSAFSAPDQRDPTYQGVYAGYEAATKAKGTQMLYEDVPYDVDPVISADSYIPNFQAPEARNPIYQGEESDLVLPSIYESGPHIDEITPSAFSAPDQRDPTYQGVYAGYEAATKAKGTQMLYEDVPYDVDPVISADSYIPRFQAPEERNPIYQGVYAGYEAAN